MRPPVFTPHASWAHARSISSPWWMAMWRTELGWSVRRTADALLLRKSVEADEAGVIAPTSSKKPAWRAPRIRRNSWRSSHLSSLARAAAVLGPATSASATPISARAAVMRVDMYAQMR